MRGLAGTRSWRRSHDWTQSGVTRSDGCDAVMRVCPLAILLKGNDIERAATTQAALTHGHPNAANAAVAADALTRRLLEGATFDASLVLRVAAQVEGPLSAPSLESWTRRGGANETGWTRGPFPTVTAAERERIDHLARRLALAGEQRQGCWGWRGGRVSAPSAYGPCSAATLSERMPAAQQDFLR
ncbi:MAG: hypothetical protein ACI9VR_004359, partial [Cognaticolwellia sp.]